MLIVDDDRAVARSLARLFMREGFVVEVAASCEEASVFPGPFDAAIVDLHLGDGSGLELGRELLLRRVVERVCFFSGASDPDLERQARSLGHFVQKGVNARELVELLSEKSPALAAETAATAARSPRKKRTASGLHPRASVADARAAKVTRRRTPKAPRSA